MNGAHKFKASRANALTSLPWFPLIIPSVSMQDLKVHTDKERTGKAFPTDPWIQLEGAIGAVFGSWMNDRAMVYREIGRAHV